MPVGPNGEKRPADVIANAVHIMKVATGEIEETYVEPPHSAESNGAGPPKREPKRKMILNLTPRKPAPAHAEK